MTPKRRIAAITTSRADWSHLFWPLHDLQAHPQVDLHILATAAHLAPGFGATISEIQNAGFQVHPLETLLHSDTDTGMAKTLGLSILSLADALSQLRPHLLLLIADRYEMLAPAAVALTLRIPIAHIEGGEISQGAIDDQVRNAITKMAHLHFTSTAQARQRVIALGEHPSRVHHTGAPSLDHLRRSPLPTLPQLEHQLGHPLTPQSPSASLSEVQEEGATLSKAKDPLSPDPTNPAKETTQASPQESATLSKAKDLLSPDPTNQAKESTQASPQEESVILSKAKDLRLPSLNPIHPPSTPHPPTPSQATGPILIAYHPVTLLPNTLSEADALFTALQTLATILPHPLLFLLPNADSGSLALITRIRLFCAQHPQAHLHINLPAPTYLSLLAHAALLLGNSSSGIMEAASLHLPAVDIGFRQQGRERAANVLHADPNPQAILDATHQALTPAFRLSIAQAPNPYDTGNPSQRITDLLTTTPLDTLLHKPLTP